jgi:hypothetical protein
MPLTLLRPPPPPPDTAGQVRDLACEVARLHALLLEIVACGAQGAPVQEIRQRRLTASERAALAWFRRPPGPVS